MRRLVISALVLAACGDNSHHNPDAPMNQGDGGVDTPSIVDALVCNYTEQHDTTNDYLAMPGAVEATGLTFSTAPLTVCGVLNNGHYSTAKQSVDIDNYGFSVSTEGDVMVTLVAPGVESFTNFNLGIYAVDTGQRSFGSGMFIGDHAIFLAHLPAGGYEISVEAYAGADISMAVPYKLKIAPDMPAARCTTVTTPANYTESHDGTNNRGNDTVTVNYMPTRYTLSQAPNDAPEPTGLTLASGTNYRLTGSSANVQAVGAYLDSDTYTVTTGATTDQLSVRLNWTGANADLDFYAFDGLLPVGVAATVGNGASESTTFAVEPNKAYRLWVGAIAGSTGLPATYDLSVCAETFTQ